MLSDNSSLQQSQLTESLSEQLSEIAQVMMDEARQRIKWPTTSEDMKVEDTVSVERISPLESDLSSLVQDIMKKTRSQVIMAHEKERLRRKREAYALELGQSGMRGSSLAADTTTKTRHGATTVPRNEHHKIEAALNERLECAHQDPARVLIPNTIRDSDDTRRTPISQASASGSVIMMRPSTLLHICKGMKQKAVISKRSTRPTGVNKENVKPIPADKDKKRWGHGEHKLASSAHLFIDSGLAIR